MSHLETEYFKIGDKETYLELISFYMISTNCFISQIEGAYSETKLFITGREKI